MRPKFFINLASDTGLEDSLAALESSCQGSPNARAFWPSETILLLQRRKLSHLTLVFTSVKWEVGA